jgi:hypothetical protein
MARRFVAACVLSAGSLAPAIVVATDYDVGEGAGMLAAIGDVPWESLGPGDRVRIHWRPEPYREKWVICRRGTAEAPIVVSGVPGPGGELPVIDGRDAATRRQLDYWNEARGVLKIGGASVPPDTLPAYLVVEKLEIRSGRPPYTFTNDSGGLEAYSSNAASIYVEKAENITIRGCVLHDSGNGLFIGAFDGATQGVLIERNRIYDNGNEGSAYEHNTYTAAIHVTYQFNHLGRLRDGCGGNNLKDRSAGLVVRYNWIEDGNRQLDLVDAEDSPVLVNHPDYRRTFVYGNIIVEGDGEGNSQIVHYGGDSGEVADYRKGILHFFHNTVVSSRSGNTTLMRLSTNDERADVRDNVVYTTAAGSYLALLEASGVMDLRDNWLRSGWVVSHSAFDGTLVDGGGNVGGTDPDFVDLGAGDLSPSLVSPLVDAGGPLHPEALPDHQPVWQYLRHRVAALRPNDGARDLGGLEAGLVFADGFESGDVSAWNGTL